MADLAANASELTDVSRQVSDLVATFKLGGS
jgi:hypothetical protein